MDRGMLRGVYKNNLSSLNLGQKPGLISFRKERSLAKKAEKLGDPYFNFVTFLSHFDGADNSTVFTDIKGNTITRNGSAVISTAQSKFGGASASFNGTNAFLTSGPTTDFDLFSNDGSIETWVYFNSLANSPHILQIGTSVNYRNVIFQIGNTIRFYTETNGSNGAPRITSNAIAVNGWYFIQIIKSGGTISMYINNVLQGSTNTTILAVGSLFLCLGHQNFGGLPGDYLNGYIDDTRLTKFAREASLPTSAFPDQ